MRDESHNSISKLQPDHSYTREIPEPAPFLSRPGAQIGGVQVFPLNQNNSGSSGVYVTYIYCSLSAKINTRKNAARCSKIMDAFALHLFLLVISPLVPS